MEPKYLIYRKDEVSNECDIFGPFDTEFEAKNFIKSRMNPRVDDIYVMKFEGRKL